MERALRQGAVPEERDSDATVSTKSGGRRRADRDRQAGRHDAVRAENADTGVRDVHGATTTPVGTGVLAHQLREHAERRKALCEAMPVAAMGRGDDVRGAQRPACADGRSLLAGREMDETRYLAVAIERSHPLFEAPDHQHPAVHFHQVIV